MKISLGWEPLAEVQGDVLALPVFEGQLTAKAASGHVQALDEALEGHVIRAALEEGFHGKPDQTFVLHTHGKISASRLLLVGLGPLNKFRSETLRVAAGRAAKLGAKLRAESMLFVLPEDLDAAELTRAVVEGFLLGHYRFDRYRSNRDEKNGRKLTRLTLLLDEARQSDEVDEALRLGESIAGAVNWARDLVNEPAAVLTPSRLAQEAQKLAKGTGLQVVVQGRREIERLKMGMFLGVTQGSAEEPKLIHIKYLPKTPADAKRPPLAFVGKAITFDSGGLSLKTAEGMVDMKTDMAGAAAVLGAMRVIAELKPPFPVHAFMGACENMPSGTAYRPGDVLISRLGKTVEITNTDAEGRLVLGDVLAYANELQPSAIIDLATLTGACIIALGNHIVGAFGDDEPLMKEVLDASKRAGEELWRLPIADAQKDALRSEIADMKNSGERWGGAINAAVFLREFVGTTPWVHLDIAGPSQSPKERGYYNKGATGVGVRTLVELVRQRAQEVPSSTHAPPKNVRRRARRAATG